jgi:hypothetical protein
MAADRKGSRSGRSALLLFHAEAQRARRELEALRAGVLNHEGTGDRKGHRGYFAQRKGEKEERNIERGTTKEDQGMKKE